MLGEHSSDLNSTVLCVLTRFGLKRRRDLLPTYIGYRNVIRKAVRSHGLLQSAFLIENLRTCYSLSIWAEGAAIPWFGTAVAEHTTEARKVFGRLSFEPGRGPELWSTKWRLQSVSNNLNWGHFDLRSVIGDQQRTG